VVVVIYDEFRCGMCQTHIPRAMIRSLGLMAEKISREDWCAARDGDSYGVRSLLVGRNDCSGDILAGTLDTIRYSVLSLSWFAALHGVSNPFEQ
jgi:hypothetical protein